MDELKIGVYQHYKDEKYSVLGVAKHSETLEDLVIYICHYDNETSKIWARPLEMFLEEVEINGKMQLRFKYLGMNG